MSVCSTEFEVVLRSAVVHIVVVLTGTSVTGVSWKYIRVSRDLFQAIVEFIPCGQLFGTICDILRVFRFLHLTVFEAFYVGTGLCEYAATVRLRIKLQ